jgi:hypothetical protein
MLTDLKTYFQFTGSQKVLPAASSNASCREFWAPDVPHHFLYFHSLGIGAPSKLAVREIENPLAGHSLLGDAR